MLAPQKPASSVEFDQVFQRIQSIVDDEEQRKELLEANGDIAQEWLDLFQLLVEYPNIPKTLRSWIFKLMIRLSRKSNLHPQCLTIRDVEKLGNYPVGGGAFGDVWKGKIGQQLVCLKVIRAFEDSDVKKTAKDYMQEAIIWRQMNHRKLLPFLGIYYLDTEQQQLCLVSPWMERGNLVQYLKKTPPELVDHESLAYDVASGLSHLHEANIVHGDLKGENVLIAPDLRACIGDFGLSRVSTTQTLLTETTRAKGTTRWLSPELLRPGPNCVNSKQSDVYAYACVCYEIFTGRYPFYELPNEGAVLCAILFEKQRPSRPDSCAKLQDSMWSMMAACWDELPPSRPTMADVLNRIHGMNADLKPLSAWEDSAFTQIWSDARYPPAIQFPRDDSVSSQILEFWQQYEHPASRPKSAGDTKGQNRSSGNRPVGAATRRLGTAMSINSTPIDQEATSTTRTDVYGPGSLMTGAGTEVQLGTPLPEQSFTEMKPVLFRAKGLYAYTASPDDPNEISFAKYEILDITDSGGKWWQARKADGTEGIAPSNFLVRLPSMEGVGTARGQLGITVPQQSSPEVKPDTCKAKALYAYTASPDDPNEMSFARLEILEITDTGKQWWRARKADGTEGIVPSNYLKII